MAKKQTFLMVSLEEDKAKKLAQVISNDTCRKILDFLASKKATESELAEKLEIPISTVHYNIKALLESKLVEAGEFHYSEKGKEVLHYSLANKYVIIAPKQVSDSFREKLKSILSAIAGIGVIALILQYSGRLFGDASSLAGTMKAESALSQRAFEAAPLAADMAAEQAVTSAQITASGIQSQPIGLWFAVGAIVFLMMYLFADYLIRRYRL